VDLGPRVLWLAWIRNGRELGSLAGLTPTPYDSGGTRCEQGISKAGNRCVRCMMIADFRGRKNNQPFYDCQG